MQKSLNIKVVVIVLCTMLGIYDGVESAQRNAAAGPYLRKESNNISGCAVGLIIELAATLGGFASRRKRQRIAPGPIYSTTLLAPLYSTHSNLPLYSTTVNLYVLYHSTFTGTARRSSGLVRLSHIPQSPAQSPFGQGRSLRGPFHGP